MSSEAGHQPGEARWPKPPTAEAAALTKQPDGITFSEYWGPTRQALPAGGLRPTGSEELHLSCVPQHMNLKENPLYPQVSGGC